MATHAHRRLQYDLKARVLAKMRREKSPFVWTANDLLEIGSRAAVDKALQRLVLSQDIRPIAPGLYDLPRMSQLTAKPTSVVYTAVIEAIARRSKIRLLVDGLTAASQLGLTNAVPARVIVHTD